jgi:hypothetical protein
MAALIAVAALALFAAGAIAGIIAVVSVAIRREERNLTLTSATPDHVTRAARLLNGVYVRAPRSAAPGREAAQVQPVSRSAREPAQPADRPAGPGDRRAHQTRKIKAGV